MGDSDTVEDGSILEGMVATGSLGVKGSSDPEEEAGCGCVGPKKDAGAVIVLRH